MNIIVDNDIWTIGFTYISKGNMWWFWLVHILNDIDVIIILSSCLYDVCWCITQKRTSM